MTQRMKQGVLGLLLILSSSFSLAEQTLFFVGDEDNKPECYIDAAGKFVGIDVDIIQEVAKRLNLNITIQLTPWVRVLAMVKSGQADGGFPLFSTAERREYAYYPQEPVHVSVMTAYTKTGKEFSYQNLQDLYGKRIGINRGYSISKEFDQAAQQGLIDLIEVETVEQLVKMLLDERIEAIAATPSSVETYLKEAKIELSAIGQVRARAAYLTLSKKSKVKDKAKLLEAVDRTMVHMKEDGTIDRIRQKYSNWPLK